MSKNVEVIQKFFGREYVFYSWDDVKKAEKLFHMYKLRDEFENVLENHNIDFCYELF